MWTQIGERECDPSVVRGIFLARHPSLEVSWSKFLLSGITCHVSRLPRRTFARSHAIVKPREPSARSPGYPTSPYTGVQGTRA